MTSYEHTQSSSTIADSGTAQTPPIDAPIQQSAVEQSATEQQIPIATSDDTKSVIAAQAFSKEELTDHEDPFQKSVQQIGQESEHLEEQDDQPTQADLEKAEQFRQLIESPQIDENPNGERPTIAVVKQLDDKQDLDQMSTAINILTQKHQELTQMVHTALNDLTNQITDMRTLIQIQSQSGSSFQPHAITDLFNAIEQISNRLDSFQDQQQPKQQQQMLSHVQDQMTAQKDQIEDSSDNTPQFMKGQIVAQLKILSESFWNNCYNPQAASKLRNYLKENKETFGVKVYTMHSSIMGDSFKTLMNLNPDAQTFMVQHLQFQIEGVPKVQQILKNFVNEHCSQFLSLIYCYGLFTTHGHVDVKYQKEVATACLVLDKGMHMEIADFICKTLGLNWDLWVNGKTIQTFNQGQQDENLNIF